MNREKLNRWVVAQLNANNMSMRELGRRAGIHQSEISKTLSGKQKAALDFYVKIAQLFDAVPKMMIEAEILSPVGEEEVIFMELIGVIKGLSLEERRHLLDYINFHAEQQGKERGKTPA